jgi:hypothetical protein
LNACKGSEELNGLKTVVVDGEETGLLKILNDELFPEREKMKMENDFSDFQNLMVLYLYRYIKVHLLLVED